MKKRFAALLIALGIAMIGASGYLLVQNRREDALAGQQAAEIVSQLQAVQQPAATPGADAASASQPLPDPYDPEMTLAELDGEQYIGILYLPNLEAPLPVMADWSYPKLKRSPCRFHGSTKTDDLVIMAHNYEHHFGGLKDLSAGDEIFFTDMDGITTAYQVAALEVLPPNAAEDMIAGDYALTLFTCTYGGKNRVTIRCDRADIA